MELENAIHQEHEYTNGDRVVVVTVDTETFCGRECHPEPEDVGMTGRVIGWCWRESFEDEGGACTDVSIDFFIVMMDDFNDFRQFADFELASAE